MRYQSFKDQKEMEQEIRKRTPHKIDIGAVFSAKVKGMALTTPCSSSVPAALVLLTSTVYYTVVESWHEGMPCSNSRHLPVQ